MEKRRIVAIRMRLALRRLNDWILITPNRVKAVIGARSPRIPVKKV
jgi:hypothetical protein